MVSSDSDAEIGRVFGGRYRVIAPIGVGASARVYLADDITLRRRVAVKVLHEALAADEGFLRRFRAEAQSAASLNHPHVLGVYDWGHDDRPYLVSEYLGGGSLQSMLDAGHRLTPSQALLVGLEAARGLEYAHAEGLVHRDIKPANLLFGEAGRLRIADFGLARALAEAGWTEPDGSMVGTARYAAPEQARGERVGPAADVYALALVINEAVCGDVPFVGDTAIATLMARAEQPLEPHPDLGPLGAVVRRAGVLDPDERPASAEFVRSLMVAAPDLPRPEPLPLVGALDPAALEAGDRTRLAPAAPADVPPRPAEPAEDEPTRRWPWVVLAVIALAVAITAGVLAWRGDQPVTHPVPALVGEDEAVATAAAIDNDWLLDLRQVRRPGTVAGEVLSVDPPAGTDLEEGETLTVEVSRGEPLVAIPDLVGETEAAAEALLEAEGLELGEVRTATSETVEVGRVIEVVTEPGQTEVEPGTSIDIVVSQGPSLRPVPEVPESGDAEEARQALRDLRLIPVDVEEYSPDVPEGDVVEFRPEAGSFAAVDDEIEVVLSLGPEPVEVPNVFSVDVDEAEAILVQAGFVVGGVRGNTALPVLFTTPPAGELHLPGTEVIIFTETPE